MRALKTRTAAAAFLASGALTLAAVSGSAQATLIKFDNLAAGADVGSSYSSLGATFTPGAFTILRQGANLTSFAQDIPSAPNVAWIGPTSGATINFSVAQSFVSLRYGFINSFEATASGGGRDLTASDTNASYPRINRIAEFRSSSGIRRITFEQGNRGDAVIDNLNFLPMASPSSSVQKLFLDFSAATVGNFGGLGRGVLNSSTFNVSGFDAIDPFGAFLANREATKEKVIEKVTSVFAPYGVQIVTTRPTSGDYSTVYFSDRSVIDGSFLDKVKLNGVAEDVDFRNRNRNDRAIVFGPAVSSCYFADCLANELSNVVIHEAGHLLGLMHLENGAGRVMSYVAANGELQDFVSGAPLMDPIAGATRQNDRYGLYQGVGGNKDPSYYGDPTDLDALINAGTFDVILGPLASLSLYDFHLFAAVSDDALPRQLFYASILDNQARVSLDGLIMPGGRLFALASTTPGGEYNVFGLSDLVGFDPLAFDLSDLLTRGFDMPAIGDSVSFSLSSYRDDGAPAPVGFGSIRNISSSVPEPTTVALLGLGLAGLATTRRRKQ